MYFYTYVTFVGGATKSLGGLSHVVGTTSLDDGVDDGISVEVLLVRESELGVEISEDLLEGGLVDTHVALHHDGELVGARLRNPSKEEELGTAGLLITGLDTAESISATLVLNVGEELVDVTASTSAASDFLLGGVVVSEEGPCLRVGVGADGIVVLLTDRVVSAGGEVPADCQELLAAFATDQDTAELTCCWEFHPLPALLSHQHLCQFALLSQDRHCQMCPRSQAAEEASHWRAPSTPLELAPIGG